MGHWDPLPGQQVCGRPWHCPQSAPLPWDTLAQHIKTCAMDLQWHGTTVWPHILGMCFLDLKLALATLLYLFVWKEAKEIITRRTASLCCVACAAFRSGISPWDGSHTPIPSANLLFRMKQIMEKVIWFCFTHCLTPKQSFSSPCASPMQLCLFWSRTRVHTCSYPRARTAARECRYSNHMHTLLQPKLCCPFILQVMTKINCELHSICTEFTVQMNSNEEYIGIQ